MAFRRNSQRILHVVSHTHWDREWYLSFERFRFRLVDLIDELLEIMERDRDFRYFQMDGQTIVLDDYLAIRPQNRVRLQRLIRAGRIQIGPWLVQNDLFLTTGEATVRNLLVGTRTCREEFGVEPMPVGYVPDQFGLISQLPQITRGFGFEYAVFGRAYDNSAGPEFVWKSPDGSGVFAVHLFQWYNNGQRLPAAPGQAVEMLREVVAGAAERAGTRHLLLMNGVDHLAPQENLSQILRQVNKRQKDFRLLHGTLKGCLDSTRSALRRPKTYKGEMRAGDNGSVLSATASTRIHLKQLNFKCQHALQSWVEPFGVFAELAGLPYDSRDMTRHAWRSLLPNHAHDSICGCSIDEVHVQMEARFRGVRDVLGELSGRALGHLADTVAHDPGAHSKVVVFNPVGRPVGGVVTLELDLLPAERPEQFELKGPDGNRLDAIIVDSRPLVHHVLFPKRLPHRLRVTRHRMVVDAGTLPACGYRSLQLVKSTNAGGLKRIAKSRSWRGKAIEKARVTLRNEHLSVRFRADGSFDLTCRDSGRTYRRMHQFEDGGERGDEYISIRPRQDRIIGTAGMAATVELVEDSGLRQTARVTHVLRLPSRLDRTLSRRIGPQAPLRIVSTISVVRGERLVRIETELENTVRDHRLRVLFPTGIQSKRAFADAPFDVMERPFQMKYKNRNHEHPMQSFCGVADRRGGVAVLTQGIPEYEVYPKDSTIAVTLLRCVDILGDMPPEFWDKPAMENDHCPDAQCLRPYRFNYAVSPFAGSRDEANLPALADAYVHRPRAVQIPVRREDWLGTRFGAPAHLLYWEDETSLPALPPAVAPMERSFLRSTNEHLVVSAVKFSDGAAAHPRNVDVVVRVVNLSGLRQSGMLEFETVVERASLARLDEKPLRRLAVARGRRVRVSAKPKEIVTVRVTLRRD